jgi:hypothetical protein
VARGPSIGDGRNQPPPDKRVQPACALRSRNVGCAHAETSPQLICDLLGATQRGSESLGYSFLHWPILILGIGIVGCRSPDDRGEPPTVPGPVANVCGRVVRGDRPVAGVHVLARVTYGIGCRVSDSAPGGTVVSMTPTDSSGRFHTMAYPASSTEERAGCLYIGAADPVRPETAWAAPRRAPAPLRGASTSRLPPVMEIDVPWPE